MSLNVWQYCWFVILSLAFMLVVTRCSFKMEEADDRARSGGGRANPVETWPWE